MGTRLYLPSSGAAAVTPSDWEFANQINPVGPFAAVRTRIGSAMTSKLEATGTTNPTFRAMGRHVFGPLAAQTITGSVKGQMRGFESNSGANASPAISCKVIQPDGSDRGLLLNPVGADSGTIGHEFAVGGFQNAKFETAGETTPITIGSVAATAGDYLVIEWGFRSATGTTRDITLSYGDDSGTDLPENVIETAAFNPWVEFSGTIAFLATGTMAPSLPKITAAMSGTVSHVGNRRRRVIMGAAA